MNDSSLLRELETEGFIVVPTVGTSMQPLLYTGKTQVLIVKKEILHKNDVVLYIKDDKLILHRIIKIRDDVCYTRGDNTFEIEEIPKKDIKGIMKTVWNNNKEIHVNDFSYHLYVFSWNMIYPLRYTKYKCKKKIIKMGKKLIGNTTLGWILKHSKDSIKGITILTLCTGIRSFLSVILALVLKQAIDYAVNLDLIGFSRWCFIFGLIIVVQLTLSAIYRQVNEKTRAIQENQLKLYTYKNILYTQYEELEKYHTGELQNRMTSDVVIVTNYAVSLFPSLISMIVQLSSGIIVLLYLNIYLGMAFLVCGIMLFGITTFFRKKIKQLHKEVQEKSGDVRSWLQETVESVLILKGFQAEWPSLNVADKKMNDHKNVRMKRITFSNICNTGYGLVMQGSYLIGLIWCGYGLIQQTMSYGTLMAVLELISQIRSPFASISGLVPEYYAMVASAERLIELEQFKKEPHIINLSDFQSLHGKNLSFVYPDSNDLILNNLDFDIENGDIIAFTGTSGIGKSTLLKLLLGIYQPSNGQLYCISDNQKININASTRSLFSYVPQGNLLMSGSIYDVVNFFRVSYLTSQDKKEIENACKIACADEFISELSHGYNTILGEKGAGLSEGQMQRLAIARAIYRKTPILLLDECTSALDEETEERLLANLKKYTNQTVLLVTHRKAALSICNKILKFENGKVLQEGC
ncbi:MAG: ATP-binding cassette domain-containing protein [Erysipelotrichaceae bacterium]|nr:ATP-binding cassette domain-containing protein [Erysipelotrichaceae bacterium]